MPPAGSAGRRTRRGWRRRSGDTGGGHRGEEVPGTCRKLGPALEVHEESSRYFRASTWDQRSVLPDQLAEHLPPTACLEGGSRALGTGFRLGGHPFGSTLVWSGLAWCGHLAGRRGGAEIGLEEGPVPEWQRLRKLIRLFCLFRGDLPELWMEGHRDPG